MTAVIRPSPGLNGTSFFRCLTNFESTPFPFKSCGSIAILLSQGVWISPCLPGEPNAVLTAEGRHCGRPPYPSGSQCTNFISANHNEAGLVNGADTPHTDRRFSSLASTLRHEGGIEHLTEIRCGRQSWGEATGGTTS